MSSSCSQAGSHLVSHDSSSAVLPPSPAQVRLRATGPLGASCHLLRVSSALCALCRFHWAGSLPLRGERGARDGRQGTGESPSPNMSAALCVFLDLRVEAVALEEALIVISRKEEERPWLVSTGKPPMFSGSHCPNPQKTSDNSVDDNNTRVAPLRRDESLQVTGPVLLGARYCAKETICQARRCSRNRLVVPVTVVDTLPSRGSHFLDRPCERTPATIV